MKMLKNKDKLWLITLPQIYLFIFLFLQIIAMLFYSGGSYFNPENSTYSLTRNFLSDLGRYKAFSNEHNFLSSQLFNMSLIIAGSIFIMFYHKLSIIFVSYKYNLAKIGSIFGILGGISLIMVGLTPSDLYFSLHVISAKWIFRFFLLTALTYSYLIYFSKILNYKYALGYIIFAISILLYILISELGPSPKTSEFSLTIQVVSQKIILIIMILSVYWQTKGIQKILL